MDKCTSTEAIHRHNQIFDNLLHENGYPPNIIRNSYATRSPPRQNIPLDYFYIKIPFVNDTINWKLKSIFRSEDIPVRFYHTNKSLRSLLSKKRNPSVCTLTACPMKNSGLCNYQNVIYEVLCKTCHKIYIGSTIRSLHTRFREHTQSVNSSIFKHLQVCPPYRSIQEKLHIRILAKESDNINIRIKEAIFIKEKRPKLNSKEELSELQMLL
jgi:hypothetical protein